MGRFALYHILKSLEVKDKILINAINSIWRDIGKGERMIITNKSEILEGDILDLLSEYLDIEESDITIE